MYPGPHSSDWDISTSGVSSLASLWNATWPLGEAVLVLHPALCHFSSAGLILVTASIALMWVWINSKVMFWISTLGPVPFPSSGKGRTPTFTFYLRPRTLYRGFWSGLILLNLVEAFDTAHRPVEVLPWTSGHHNLFTLSHFIYGSFLCSSLQVECLLPECSHLFPTFNIFSRLLLLLTVTKTQAIMVTWSVFYVPDMNYKCNFT